MAASNAFLKLSLGADVTPNKTYAGISGFTKVLADLSTSLPDVKHAYTMRAYFPAGAATLAFAPYQGLSILTGGTGVRQVNELITLGDPTAPGMLEIQLVISSAAIFSVQVQVRPEMGTVRLRQAILNALLADPDMVALANFSPSPGPFGILYSRKYGQANETTYFKLQCVPALGITNLPSTIKTAGVVGTVLERLGSTGADAYNQAIPALGSGRCTILFSVPQYGGVVECPTFGSLRQHHSVLYSGTEVGLRPWGAGQDPITNVSSGGPQPAILDVTVLLP